MSEEAKVCSPEVKHYNLAFFPPLSSEDPDANIQLISTVLNNPSKTALLGQNLCRNTNSFENWDTSQVLRFNLIFCRQSKTLLPLLYKNQNQTKVHENVSTVIIGALGIQ